MTTSAARSAAQHESLTLSEGTVVTLRPMVPEDGDSLIEFHRQLSDRTIFLRYFYPHRVLGTEEIEHLTQLDGRDRMALVVESDGQLVAVGRYERAPGSPEAEVAFVVADAFQHRGLGTVLLQRLATAARLVSITTFSADVLTENSKMLAVFHESGFAATSSFDCGTVHLQMAIGPEADVQVGTLQTSRVPPPAGT
jgi:RimJ/RimL family protein N-acetyltransferase